MRVILSEAKDLDGCDKILRFAQDDGINRYARLQHFYLNSNL